MSEYMIGSVAIGLILPESTGAIDPTTENWTSEERQKVYDEVLEGMISYMMNTQKMDEITARVAAGEYMARMPAWSNRA